MNTVSQSRDGRAPTILPPMLVLLLPLLALSACTSLFHNAASPEQVYYLDAGGRSAGNQARPATPAPSASVRILHPVAAPGMDSPQIRVIQSDRRLSFYSAARWPAAVPDMVESLAVQTLRDSQSWRAVMDSSSGLPADYLLQIGIRRFEAQYGATRQPPVVHVVFDCTVARREGREVIATFVVTGASTASADRMGDVVAAFEDAANTALSALSERTLEVVQAASHSAQPSTRP